MRTRLLFVVSALCACVISSCTNDNENEDAKDKYVAPLSSIADISLNYHATSKSVTLSRDVEAEGATVSLNRGASWINNLKLKGNKVTFEVEENASTFAGHRFDTIVVSVRGKRIGTVCVSQARNPFSSMQLAWANPGSGQRLEELFDGNSTYSGLELTKIVYNLEKTTGGRDSYKNYPAFAFCIEMNHNPEKKIEWYLPTWYEMNKYANGQSYKGTFIQRHDYWWSSTECGDTNAFYIISSSYGQRNTSKRNSYWVVAFRDGKLEE